MNAKNRTSIKNVESVRSEKYEMKKGDAFEKMNHDKYPEH